MPVKTLPFKSLQSLVKAYLSADTEGEGARSLLTAFLKARHRGYLTKPELEKVCAWKSARVMKQVRRNSPACVRKITRSAFSSTSELEKIRKLITLHGVGVPMASAILMFMDPQQYPVIDIRGWQLLHAMKAVKANERGANLTPGQWVEFLGIVRSYARQFGVSARDVQRALFEAHVEFQEGKLYRD